MSDTVTLLSMDYLLGVEKIEESGNFRGKKIFKNKTNTPGNQWGHIYSSLEPTKSTWNPHKGFKEAHNTLIKTQRFVYIYGIRETRISHPRKRNRVESWVNGRETNEAGRGQVGNLTAHTLPQREGAKPACSACGKILNPSEEEPILIPDIVITARRGGGGGDKERKGNQGIDRKTSFYFLKCLGCHYEATMRLPLLAHVDSFFPKQGRLFDV